jgi:DNA-binding MarR family transcriptional regulator
MRVMLEENLLQADALIALCSKLSRTSPWLWWESGSVWARGKLVVPLFIDVTPAEFGGPIQIVRQGRAASDHGEVNSLIETVVRQFQDNAPVAALSEAEQASLDIALAKAAKAASEGPTIDVGAVYELLSRKGGGGIRFVDLALELGSKPSIVRRAVEEIAREGFIQVYVLNDDEVVFNLPAPQGG